MVLPGRLYSPGEVADAFRVDPKTVVRWIKAGQFRDDEYLRTAGGHHRVYGRGILRLASEGQAAA